MNAQNGIHVFLCSAIVVDEYENLLFEETFMVGVESSMEEEAQKIITEKLMKTEKLCQEEMSRPLFLSCHCAFPMSDYVMVETISSCLLFEKYKELAKWKLDGK